MSPPLPRRRDLHTLRAPQTDGFGAAGVLLCFKDAELEQMVLDLCTLADVEPARVRSDAPVWPDIADLPHILTDCLEVVPAEVNRWQVTVLDNTLAQHDPGVRRADFSLPDHEPEVLRLLAQLARGGRRNACADLVVAWHGGGGATAVATQIARLKGVVLLDAAGNFSTMPAGAESQIGWGHLDADDLPPTGQLLSALGAVDGVTRLTSATGSPVSAGHPVVAAVTGALDGEVVIDCGTALGQAIDLREALHWQRIDVRLLLVGGADIGQQARLARTLTELLARASKQANDAASHGDGVQEGGVQEGAVLEDGAQGAGAHGKPREQGPPELADVGVLLRGRPNDVFRAVMSRFPVRWWRLPRLSSHRRWERLLEKIDGGPR